MVVLIFYFQPFYGDKEEYPTVRIELYRDIMRRICYFSFDDSIVYLYQNYDVTDMNNYFTSTLCKELHLYLNTSSCTNFTNLFYNMRNDIYISGLDMSNEKTRMRQYLIISQKDKQYLFGRQQCPKNDLGKAYGRLPKRYRPLHHHRIPLREREMDLGRRQ